MCFKIYWKTFNQKIWNNCQTSQKKFKIKIVFKHEPLWFNTKSFKTLKGVNVWAPKKIFQIHIPLAQIYKTCTNNFEQNIWV
jgi:hypothetical protein